MSNSPLTLPLFNTVAQLWQQYSSNELSLLPSNDPRHNLAVEVRERIAQLDECLELVNTAIASLESDPAVLHEQFRFILGNGPKLESGEISKTEFVAKMSSRHKDPEGVIRIYSRIRLFTEAFYFVAWRLRQVINAHEPRKFPRIGKLQAVGVCDVRNLLIEHPEDRHELAQFEQLMVLTTNNGPVLKSSTVVVNLTDGKTTSDSQSLDKGLFVNATTFEAELRSLLSEVIQNNA